MEGTLCCAFLTLHFYFYIFFYSFISFVFCWCFGQCALRSGDLHAHTQFREAKTMNEWTLSCTKRRLGENYFVLVGMIMRFASALSMHKDRAHATNVHWSASKIQIKLILQRRATYDEGSSSDHLRCNGAQMPRYRNYLDEERKGKKSWLEIVFTS